MRRTPQKVTIKPKLVDVGRGPELAKVPYPSKVGGRMRLLPEGGAAVSLTGADGSYWQRRINEGCVIIVERASNKATAATTREKVKED